MSLAWLKHGLIVPVVRRLKHRDWGLNCEEGVLKEPRDSPLLFAFDSGMSDGDC